MIGDITKNLEEVERYLIKAGEKTLYENVAKAKWFLWETWDELLRATIGVNDERPD